MAEIRRRVLRGSSLLGPFLAALLILAAPGRATAAEPLYPPGGFELPASNGYTMRVVGMPSRGHHPAAVDIVLAKPGEFVEYTAPATVTETSIQANLGALGEISVAFQRSGQAESVGCGRQKIHLDSGAYDGVIDFHGEEGYASVEATTAPGSGEYVQWICGEFVTGGSGNFGQRSRGAALRVRDPALGPGLSVAKRRPGSAAEIRASMSEWDDGISILRSVGLRIPGPDFGYDPNLRTATLRPPAPFAGTARFDRAMKAGRRWSGNLTVNMPGKAAVSLTGPLLRATLVPYWASSE